MRLPVILRQTDPDAWRYELPTLGVLGSASSRNAAISAAQTAVEALCSGQQPQPVATALDVVFLQVQVRPETPGPIRWREVQRVTLEILGQQWQMDEPDHDGSLVSPPRRWFLLWPPERQTLQIELLLFPGRLGATLNYLGWRGSDDDAEALTLWLELRASYFVPNLAAFEAICHVLAGPPPQEELAGILAGSKSRTDT